MKKEIVKLSLPSAPRELAYENYVAALLLEGGYFLDRSIHKKVDGAGEIFEVDIITYKFVDGNQERRLLELKSGDWSKNDVFKVKGWMDFIGIKTGAFIVQQLIDEKKFPSWQEAFKNIDIELIDNHKLDDDTLHLDELNNVFKLSRKFDESILATIRYSFTLEHCMRSYLSQQKKSRPDYEGLKQLWGYTLAVQDITFQHADPAERIHTLFDLFIQNKSITGRIDHEWSGEKFSDTNEETIMIDGHYKSYLLADKGKSPVYSAQLVELQNRIKLLQLCVEYILRPEKVFKNKFERIISNLRDHSIALNIQSCIDYLKSDACPNYYKYPLLWQLFIHVMGGFILEDLEDREIQVLSDLTEMPVDEVKNALGIFDLIFPLSGGTWIRPIGYTRIKHLLMMPAPLMGMGANFRRLYYRDADTDEGSSFETLNGKLTGEYTYNNLLKWNSIAFEYLKSDADLVKTYKE